jgi:hypothetical protein
MHFSKTAFDALISSRFLPGAGWRIYVNGFDPPPSASVLRLTLGPTVTRRNRSRSSSVAFNGM